MKRNIKFTIQILILSAFVKLTTLEHHKNYLTLFLNDICELSIKEENIEITENFYNRNNMIFLILKEDNNSYYLPISESFEGDNEQIYSNEIIMLINSIKYKDTNLSVKNVLEILVKNKIFIFPGLFELEKLKEYVLKYEKDTFQHDRSLRHGRSMVLKFIREYIGRIDNFISKSENGIYFIGHNFRKDTISLNMKSFFGESEVNDTITIIECENELKHINIEFKIFFFVFNFKIPIK
ncbi:hypothetical protein CWI38_1457p0030 [Hamiltosporidium tvaerminnensis]|uniref:Uncharacterized protein n=1 Tax=Hamiltosporidium tvaerminnensis TaxID=1176355 RepID=A0A4Q9LQX9_9MICR|nr:hypothetical protein CWI38_1457p0030 [Hamiltosporidium tvaerminnensis]